MIGEIEKKIILSYIFLIGSLVFSISLILFGATGIFFWFEVFRIIVYVAFLVLFTVLIASYGPELRVAIEGLELAKEISATGLIRIRADVIQTISKIFKFVFYFMPFIDQFFCVVSIILSIISGDILLIGISFIRLAFIWIILWVIK